MRKKTDVVRSPLGDQVRYCQFYYFYRKFTNLIGFLLLVNGPQLECMVFPVRRSASVGTPTVLVPSILESLEVHGDLCPIINHWAIHRNNTEQFP